MAVSFRPEFRSSSFFLVFALIIGSCAGPEEAAITPSAPIDGGEMAPIPPSGAELVDEAASFAASGDFNRALNLYDRACSFPEQAALPQFWREFGNLVELFIQQRVAEGESDGLLIADLHREAAAHFAKSLDLPGAEQSVWINRAFALRQAGDFNQAWEAVDAALASLTPNLSQQLEIGRVGLALTIEAMQAGQAVPAAATTAGEQLHLATVSGNREAIVLLSDLYAWQGLNAEARTVLVGALGTYGENAELLRRLKNLNADDAKLLATDMELVRNARPGDGWVLWYTGEAWYLRQVQARNSRNFVAAYEAIDRAEECFLQAKVMRQEFTSSCEDWLHLTRTARGWALWQEGRVDDAGQAFLAALEAAPAKLEDAATTGTLHLGIEAVVGDAFAKNDKARARTLLKRVVALHRDNAMWFNNLGLATRDLAEPRIRRDFGVGKALPEGELKDLIDEAWEAYSRAVELAPNDPNILNDHALLAVYYLDHSLELADRELRRAIELGEERLSEIDKEAEYEVWRRTDMSVGDAWENLAFLEIMRYHRVVRAPEYLDNSSLHWPFERRNGVEMLRREMKKLQQQ